MKFTCFQPAEKLRNFVKQYWVMNCDTSWNEKTEILFPVGAVEIIFHLEEPLSRLYGQDWIAEGKMFVEGLQSGTLGVKFAKRTRTVGITLYPWATEALFKLSSLHFTNQRYAANDVDRSFEKLYERLSEAKSDSGLFAVCDEHLSRLLSSSTWSPGNSELQTLDVFKKMSTIVEMKELKAGWPYSSKLFQKRFKCFIGMSAGELLKKKRMAKALKMLVNRDGRSLTDISHSSAFYDQAHFIKDFRHYFQTSPKFFAGGNNVLDKFLA